MALVLPLHDLRKSRVGGGEWEDNANFIKLIKEEPNDWMSFKGVTCF